MYSIVDIVVHAQYMYVYIYNMLSATVHCLIEAIEIKGTALVIYCIACGIVTTSCLISITPRGYMYITHKFAKLLSNIINNIMKMN